MTDRSSPTDRYVFAGEFHYFRNPRATWHDRLAQVRDLGFEAVSIYVPWNWHEARPGALDFTGHTNPERDLFGALDEIAAAGLDCIYRPGPFITAEWRDGGIPAWLWERDPSIVALDAAGKSASAGRPYPALTYAHPAYEGPAVEWLVASIESVGDYFKSRGGPIVHLQLDDEPSYWQQLDDPLALDYNPWLIAPVGDRPSRYAQWLLDRHGSLDAVNAAHHTTWARPAAIEPPRVPMAERRQLTRYVDWLDFKLNAVDEHVVILDRAARGTGFDGPISMLFPYLLPLQAAKFAAFARERGLELELTNECYVTLFGATESPEQKVAHVIACHETYHMWRGPDQGPAFTMELQGSNSSFIAPGVMEMLYAVTIARGIRGFNIFMLVGGENPAGFENGTGREYDLDAPIGLHGELRPHAAVLARQMRVVRAIEPELLRAQPLRDTWIACHVPYESAALVAGRGVFGDAGAAVTGMFSNGDFGLSNAPSLSALLTLSGVSWGALDLERSDAAAWEGARQLWVPGLEFMSRAIQERLADWMAAGGDLVILPAVPVVDEQMASCRVLADAIFGAQSAPVFPSFEPEPIGWSQVRTLGDGSLAVHGEIARLPVPADGTAIAWADDGAAVAFRRPVGAGSATAIGFRLQYHPVGGRDQFAFATSIVEASVGQRAAFADVPGAVALELAGPHGGLLCLVNPVERSQSTRVRYTIPGTQQSAIMPTVLPAITLAARGARLLPLGITLGPGLAISYATAELVARSTTDSGRCRLTFAAAQGTRFELAIEGRAAAVEVEQGQAIGQPLDMGPVHVFVIEAEGPEVVVSVAQRQDQGQT